MNKATSRSEVLTLMISIPIFIALIVVLSFLNVLFEFLFLGLECVWMVISGLFYYVPRWCYRKVYNAFDKEMG
jgi:hypothetical protein